MFEPPNKSPKLCGLGCLQPEAILFVLDVGHLYSIWGFPKIRGSIWLVPTIGTIVFWGLYWGLPVKETTRRGHGGVRIIPQLLPR